MMGPMIPGGHKMALGQRTVETVVVVYPVPGTPSEHPPNDQTSAAVGMLAYPFAGWLILTY